MSLLDQPPDFPSIDEVLTPVPFGSGSGSRLFFKHPNKMQFVADVKTLTVGYKSASRAGKNDIITKLMGKYIFFVLEEVNGERTWVQDSSASARKRICTHFSVSESERKKILAKVAQNKLPIRNQDERFDLFGVTLNEAKVGRMKGAEYVARLNGIIANEVIVSHVQTIKAKVDVTAVTPSNIVEEIASGRALSQGIPGPMELVVQIGTKDDAALPMDPHLKIKQTTVAGAGLGVFAFRVFKKDDVIGAYTGRFVLEVPKGRAKDYTVQFQNGFVDGFSEGIGMGMQIINDYYYCRSNRTRSTKTNVGMGNDLLIYALRDILPGEKLFLDYRKNSDVDTVYVVEKPFARN